LRIVDHADVNVPRDEVDKGIQNYANNVHIQDSMHSYPYFVVKGACKKEWRKMLNSTYSDAFAQAAGEFYALMIQRWGYVEIVIQKQLMFFCFLHRHLFTPEKMLQDFDFPIAFCNGTRDFFGSAEGAHTIVKGNRYH